MKNSALQRLGSFAAAACVAVAAACGGSPTSPSSAAGGPVGVLAGTVVTGDASNATASSGPRLMSGGFRTMKTAAPGVTITIVGTDLTVTTAVDGSFVLEGVPAGTTITLKFSGPGIDATLTLDGITEGQVVHVTIRVEGTTAELDDEDDLDDSDEQEKDEIEGLISAITPAPPAITVNGLLISVPIGTPIRHGSRSYEFADLVVGDRVHVKAHTVGSSLVAMEVNLQNGEATPGHGHDDADDDETDDDGPGHGNGNGHENDH